MTRTIRVGYPPVVRIVPVSEVVMAYTKDDSAYVHLRSEVAVGDELPWQVYGASTEAELLAALGWSCAPPPPHPTARALLDVLRDLHADGTLTAVYDVDDRDDAPLDRAVSEWAAAGYPGARRSS